MSVPRAALNGLGSPGMVVQTVLTAVLIVVTTANMALWAFRPGWFRTGPRAARGMGVVTAIWVIVLPAGGGVSLGLGAEGLAHGQPAAWQGIAIGVIAMACWPVTIAAVRKRRATRATPGQH